MHASDVMEIPPFLSLPPYHQKISRERAGAGPMYISRLPEKKKKKKVEYETGAVQLYPTLFK